jgi:esterase/lipase superfamily enzyme
VASTRRDDRQIGEAITSEGVHHSLVMMSVPTGHMPGVIETPSFGKASRDKHIVQTGGRVLNPERFKQELATHLSGRIGTNRDVLLYVHGFNTSLDEARSRLTQIVYDARFGGVPVLFTWPSKSTLFGYVSDKDQATASRDALQSLMRDLSQLPGVGRVHVLAHSMGSWLAMEALRENAIAGRPDLNGKLGDVMLAAPDIDLAVFRQQIARLPNTRVSIFVSRADRALSLSSRIAGDRPRVGAMDPNNARDAAALQELGVRVYDLSSFSAGLIGHAAYADTPDVIRSIGAQLSEPRKEEAGSVAVIDARGQADNLPPMQTPAKPESSTGAPLQPMQ